MVAVRQHTGCGDCLRLTRQSAVAAVVVLSFQHGYFSLLHLDTALVAAAAAAAVQRLHNSAWAYPTASGCSISTQPLPLLLLLLLAHRG
jgi:hypothetical protein